MSKKQKLFVSWDGSDPDCYKGPGLCECIGAMLSCLGVADDNMEFVLSDLDRFISSGFDHDGRLRAKFSTSMGCSAEWCYGYDSFEEAFNDDN